MDGEDEQDNWEREQGQQPPCLGPISKTRGWKLIEEQQEKARLAAIQCTRILDERAMEEAALKTIQNAVKKNKEQSKGHLQLGT
jgi:hypothetical protein